MRGDRSSGFDVVIIGAGPGGICMGIKLLEAGIRDFVILEKASGVGGTWWHNRYPGAECDVPSRLYSFSFAPKLDWSRRFARQPEILEYLRDLVDEYALMPFIRLDSEVASARWDEDSASWRVETTGGAIVEGRRLVGAVGMYSEPAFPDIPGLDEFGGTLFHTAEWADGHDLSGERVALVGTAASAVQTLPEIAPVAGELFVYQRTPQWVLPKDDARFSEDEIRRFVEDAEAARAERAELHAYLETIITFSDPEMLAKAESAGRQRLEVVEDPETRKKLTPSMAYGCRRPLSSNDYYPTFNRPDVTLVTDPIERVEGRTVHTSAGGTPVDTLILATGFRTTRYLSCVDVYGRGGLPIREAWRDGPQAYLGITTANFPNLFMLYGPNTNNGSILEMIELQVAYSIRKMLRLEKEGFRWLAVKPDVMATYNEALQKEIDAVEVWQGHCGGYYHGPAGTIVTQWPHTVDAYQARLEADGDSLDSFDFG